MERQRRGERELKDREKEKENGKSEKRRKKMLRQRNRQERRIIYGNKSDKNYKDSVTRASGPCHVGNTSSHFNTEVKQHRAWIVLGWETSRELQVLLTKTKAWLRC